MSIPSSHPLLSLVDTNKNTLKCALIKYIDVTVEHQFGQIRNRIVDMIESGEIVHVNASDQLFTSDTLPSLVNTVTTELTLIKQECHDSSSSSTIPINVQCNDAPNDDHNDSEDEGELISDYAECADCVNGICGLDGQNDYAHNDAETGMNMKSGLGEGVIEDDEPNEDNQSSDNANNLSLINESEQQIRSNQNAIKQNAENDQSVDNQQSIPFTSGLRSSDRKRFQRKLFGVDQSSEEVKCDKRKSKSNSNSKAVKKVRKQNVEEFHQDEEEGKLQVVTLQVNCTEAGCKTILNSFKMWKQHLSSTHDQLPYQHLHDNVRHNQHGQTEYPCTKCEAVCNSQDSLILHWKMYHLSGKFKCSICAFVGNLWCEVRNHYRNNHLRKTFQCTQEGCNQTFQFMNNLEIHQRIHTGERPYKCTWDNCEVSFNQIGTAIQHVRLKHFRLPRTVREQKELNIIDERDPKVYIQVSRG